MKSSKANQKFKKSNSSENIREKKIKRVKTDSKKEKNFKKDIYDEIDEFEEIDLFGNKEEFLEHDEDSEE
ncbi:MAG: hypothetical protein JEY96_13370 [Bacteroidales bacterium]|nr:hypothetical protein [Bacteroidales bacterium]